MPVAEQKMARFRFYGALNDFLGGAERATGPVVRYSFWGRPAVKDAIEAQGVPHPEVELVLVNETPVSFDHALAEGDRVSVYPWLHDLPRPETSLRPSVPDPPSFVCDVHLGQLARYLRMLGLDTRYDTEHTDPTLARLSADEDRVLLTRDVDLLRRSRVQLGAFVRPRDPQAQLAEVVRRFSLAEHLDPLSRCLACNTELEPATPTAVDQQVPPHTRETHETFVQCPTCDSVYWTGSHVRRMRDLIADVTPSEVSLDADLSDFS